MSNDIIITQHQISNNIIASFLVFLRETASTPSNELNEFRL